MHITRAHYRSPRCTLAVVPDLRSLLWHYHLCVPSFPNRQKHPIHAAWKPNLQKLQTVLLRNLFISQEPVFAAKQITIFLVSIQQCLCIRYWEWRHVYVSHPVCLVYLALLCVPHMPGGPCTTHYMSPFPLWVGKGGRMGILLHGPPLGTAWGFIPFLI